MHIFQDSGLAWDPADPARFAGAARVKRVGAVPEDPPVKIYRVAFEAGARTDWHTHSGPQLLYVAPGEKHWHGAAPDAHAVHVAVNIDAQTTWMERVTDEKAG